MFVLCQFKRNFFLKTILKFSVHRILNCVALKTSNVFEARLSDMFLFLKRRSIWFEYISIFKVCIVWRVQTVNWYSKKFEINDWAQCQYIKYCILASYNQTFAHFLAASLPFSLSPFLYWRIFNQNCKGQGWRKCWIFFDFFSPGEVHLTAGTACCINITALTLVRSEQKLELPTY